MRISHSAHPWCRQLGGNTEQNLLRAITTEHPDKDLESSDPYKRNGP